MEHINNAIQKAYADRIARDWGIATDWIKLTSPKTVEPAKIERVIFNDPATVVFWKDGSKTVVKCQDGDIFDEKTGLLLCIAKKFFGNKGAFNDVLREWVPEPEYSATVGLDEISRTIVNAWNTVKACLTGGETEEPSFDWDAFGESAIVARCETEDLARDFLTKAKERGFRWGMYNDALFGVRCWEKFRLDTCYGFGFCDQYLGYCEAGWYEDNGAKVVNWREGMK